MANNLKPPTSASATYEALHKTALDFISAQAQNSLFPSRMDFDRIRALCSTDFQHSWGHNYATYRAPPIQGSHSVDAFIAHLQKMLPSLESWETDITDIIVDEVQLKVMLRLSFWMRAKGVSKEDIVENDLLWLLEMSKDGVNDNRSMKVRRSVEFIDAVAAGKLKELMSRPVQA